MSATPHRRRRNRRLVAAAASLAAVGALVSAMPAQAGVGSSEGQVSPSGHGGPGKGRTVDVQLLSFNDFHGNLEPPSGSSGRIGDVPAGGVAHLAASLRTAREGNPYSVTAAAGDMVGASPLVSGLFHDEPTIEAMNGLGLDVTGVGNHEFDEGATELERLQDGGCHPLDGCYEDDRKFEGADFPYLAANVTEDSTGKPLLDPTWVWKKDGVKIGFIGVTLEGTPGIVSAEGIKGLSFHDETETINKYARKLQKQGVKSIVALIHEGGNPPAGAAYDYDCDSPGPGDGISGPIVDIAENVTPQVDMLVTGHTHNPYVCTIPDPAGKPRTVTSAASYGRLYTDTTMTYDRATGDIVRTSVEPANHIVRRDQEKAEEVAGDMISLVDRWTALAAPVAARPVGHIAEDIPGRGSTAYEKPLGDLIADAQLAHAEKADGGAVDLALMNPGGIRSDLVHATSGDEGDGVVTYGEAYTVQPFSNTVNVVDLTGEQLVTALRQQVSGANEKSVKILQVSEGLTYTLDMTRSGADRVVTDSIRLHGKAIDPSATYRVAMNSFLTGGGDGFTALGEGTNELVGGDDLAALIDYLTANSSAGAPLGAPAADRITVVQ
ncbi:bifunctional metallophosphatase/5'-nucleotidase [Streptomyces sp. NPDC059637]|uniref:bifunctional metallophosphatase/5'-nucleotidase n=1 Tax=Streptomyces sp. NPDC059637 TaxID=3347752 RepID=UPI00368D6A64